MRFLIHKLVILSIVVSLALAADMLVVVQRPNLFTDRARAATFNPDNLIENGTFTHVDAMSVSQIQDFLTNSSYAGGFLKNYNENGRSAAQIIYDAAHGYGQASNNNGTPINGILITSSTGTVNPRVILVTLQKEQGLLTMANQNDNSLRTAMGYGCPDSGGCNSEYAGFTKQVENGAWQLRYNYERAQGTGFSDYQVGQSMTFSDHNGNHTVTIANRATAALYRYTPHVYNGNYNFWTLFNLYFPSYRHSWVGQSGHITLAPEAANQFSLTVKNTGSATWQKGVVNLGTDRGRDRVPVFTREGNGPSGWISPNRIQMQESSVAPGSNATFVFWMRNDGVSPGTYREHFRLVADGIEWMEDYGVYWEVTATPLADAYHHQWIGQNAHPASITTLSVGQAYQFSVTFKNTGSTTWRRGVVNLGTDGERDRIPAFARESHNGSPSGWISPNRIQMQESSVAPGSNATFVFWMRNDGLTSGTYREHFRLVADEITWFPENYGVYWDVPVN